MLHAADFRQPAFPLQDDTAVRVVEHRVPGDGHDFTACATYPADAAGPLPWLIYLHAGGFVDGGLEKTQRLVHWLAVAIPAVVVTPAYSLAPDRPFPAAPEDAFATVAWVMRQARKLKVEKTRFAIVGEEAGGNLAIALAQMLRDRGLPAPAAQWLVRPVTDPGLQMASCPNRPGGQVPMETLRQLASNYREYLPTPADSVHPYAAPAMASRLAGLPPTLIQVAEKDALRAEGEAFGVRLAKAGVPAETLIMPGACGDGVEQSHDRCQAWVNEGAKFLRQALPAAAVADEPSPRRERRTGTGSGS